MNVLANMLVALVSGFSWALSEPLLYLGPETVMPVASALAAILGFLMIFWRFIVSRIKQILGIKSAPSVDTAEQETSSIETGADVFDDASSG